MRFEESAMGFEFFRRSVVDARRVETHRVNLPFSDQPAGGVRLKAGEMQLRDRWRAALVGPQIRFAVGSGATETGADQHDRSIGDPAVLFLPRLEVGDRNAMVRIFRTAF